MNWFAFLSLITLSAFLLANALAFERAAKEWAKNLSESLKNTPPDPTYPKLEFPAIKIQDALDPPCVNVWLWLGLLSVVGSLIAGEICIGWHAIVVGIIAAWIAAKIARGIWPQPSSRIYFAAFYECLNWRLGRCLRDGKEEQAHWHATLMAIMEHIEKRTKEIYEESRAKK
jgi:hypothetical protein